MWDSVVLNEVIRAEHLAEFLPYGKFSKYHYEKISKEGQQKCERILRRDRLPLSCGARVLGEKAESRMNFSKEVQMNWKVEAWT